jgi:hypothetical protein
VIICNATFTASGLEAMNEKGLRDDELGKKGIYTIMQEQSEK